MGEVGLMSVFYSVTFWPDDGASLWLTSSRPLNVWTKCHCHSSNSCWDVSMFISLTVKHKLNFTVYFPFCLLALFWSMFSHIEIHLLYIIQRRSILINPKWSNLILFQFCSLRIFCLRLMKQVVFIDSLSMHMMDATLLWLWLFNASPFFRNLQFSHVFPRLNNWKNANKWFSFTRTSRPVNLIVSGRSSHTSRFNDGRKIPPRLLNQTSVLSSTRENLIKAGYYPPLLFTALFKPRAVKSVSGDNHLKSPPPPPPPPAQGCCSIFGRCALSPNRWTLKPIWQSSDQICSDSSTVISGRFGSSLVSESGGNPDGCDAASEETIHVCWEM